MPSVYRQKNNIVPAIRGCAKSAAPDVLYAARIDIYRKTLDTTLTDAQAVQNLLPWNVPAECRVK